jgi:uncharacterized protein YbjT (DUF2867 family)
MKFLVIGATGTVGSQVTRELQSRGHQVRALTRNPEKAAALGTGIEVVKGDLLDPATQRTLYWGVDGALLINTVSPTESHEGLMVVCGAQVAGLKRIVYVSVQHADRAAHLPHFGSKVGVEAAIKRSGIPFTILRPSNFFQNDYWLRDAILQHGVYPQPFGNTGVSRVDVRDIAEAAAIALTQSGHDGKTYDLIGPRPLKAIETAEIWSKALNRKVVYAGDDLDAWEKASAAFFSPTTLYDFKHMFAYFQKHGLVGTPEEVATLTNVLGHESRSFEGFSSETAKMWSEQGAGARG